MVKVIGNVKYSCRFNKTLNVYVWVRLPSELQER